MNKPLTRAEIAELCNCRPSDIPRDPVWSLTRFEPPGPVCASYIRSVGPIDAITGPSGSGKTVGTVFKLVRFAVASMPVTKSGVVKVRITVLRDNYRALYRTTLRSWFQWFPPDYPGSQFFGGQDRPALHRLRLSTVRTIDGVRREVPVDLDVDFFAVGDVAIEELLKGYETSAGWANEGDLLAERVIPFLYDRTGRYPSKAELADGVTLPRMVAVDFNPTPPNHPLWKACIRKSFQQEKPEDPLEAALQETAAANVPAAALNFFQQPSGLASNAENRRGKSYEDYARAAAVMTENDVRRFVHGLPGYAMDGKPVYSREFDRKRHVAAGRLQVIRGLPLHIGFDQGNSPAAILFQVSSHGQVRIYKELWLGQGVGYGRFLQALIPILTSPPFRDLPPGIYTADPAGFYGADKVAGELAWAQSISAGLGHPVYPAATNEPSTRQEAVRLRLSYQVDATTPGLIIDPEGCPLLIEGFEAEYKFPKLGSHAATEYGDAPLKNTHANLHDANQYGILGVFSPGAVVAEAAQAGRPGNVVPMSRRARSTSPAGGSWDFSPWR